MIGKLPFSFFIENKALPLWSLAVLVRERKWKRDTKGLY